MRTLTGVLIVLVVFYSGLLLYFISGPSMDSVDNLRTLARWVLISAIVVAWAVIFLGLPMFSIGSADEAVEGVGSVPVLDEEEVLLEEYLGLSDEDALSDAAEELDEEDSEEGHA